MESPQPLRPPTPKRRRAHNTTEAPKQQHERSRCRLTSRSRQTSRDPRYSSNVTKETLFNNACRRSPSNSRLCGVCAIEEPEIPADEDILETELNASTMVQTSRKLESEEDGMQMTTSTTMLRNSRREQELRVVPQTSTTLREWQNRYSLREVPTHNRRHPNKNAHLTHYVASSRRRGTSESVRFSRQSARSSRGRQMTLAGVATRRPSMFGLPTPPNAP